MATADKTTQNPQNRKAPGQPQPQKNPRKRKCMLMVLAVVVIARRRGVWGWYDEFYGRWSESTDDAYVNGNVVEITPQTPAPS
jgi:membrane fusion protein (multidrug efflux system)